MIIDTLKKIKNRLVVSCQAEGDSPFNNPQAISLFAIAANQGGAGGIRSEGIEKIKNIKMVVNLPLIGIIKKTFEDGSVCITREKLNIQQLIEAGADMVAIDGTARLLDHMDGPSFIRFCKIEYPYLPIIADISTIEEALLCIENGADAVSTTLRGYTPSTAYLYHETFDFDFLRDLICTVPHEYPVIAEGKIKNPEMVRIIKDIGAWSVVVGSAITRPVQITKDFVEAYKN